MGFLNLMQPIGKIDGLGSHISPQNILIFEYNVKTYMDQSQSLIFNPYTSKEVSILVRTSQVHYYINVCETG